MQVEQGTLRIHSAAEKRVLLPFQCIGAPALMAIAAPVPANRIKAAVTNFPADLPDAAGTDAVLRANAQRERKGAVTKQVLASFQKLSRMEQPLRTSGGTVSLFKSSPFLSLRPAPVSRICARLRNTALRTRQPGPLRGQALLSQSSAHPPHRVTGDPI